MNCHAPTLWRDRTLAVPRRTALARLAGLALRTFAALTLAICLSATAANSPTEHQVKAAFVFNFIKFTDWPSSAFTNAATPLVIGVAGEDPFGRTLDDVVKDELVNGRRLVVKRLPPGDDGSTCHVLFISRSEKERVPAWLDGLKKKPVLTVSDLDQFGHQGGMINLALSANGTVKPEINPDAARAARVQISSKLLNLPSVKLVKTER